MLQQLEAKIEALAKQLEQSAANHNYLLGCKAALESMAADFKAGIPVIEEVAAVVAPTEAPVIDAAVSTIEGVVSEF